MPRTLTRLFLFLCCCSCLALSARAQTLPILNWAAARSIGPALPPEYEATVDAAGNTYVVATFQNSTTIGGTTLTSRGDLDGYVAKFTPAGALAWVQQIGAGSTERAVAVAVDAAGNVYVTGRYINDVSLGNGLTLTWASSLAAKMYLVCYSPQGVPLWARQGNTAGNYGGGGSDIGLDAAGNIYVTGLFTNTMTFGTTRLTLPGGGLASGLFLVKYNSAGTVQWASLACDFLAIGGTLTYQEPTLTVSPGGAVFLLNRFSEQVRFGGGAVLVTPVARWDMLAAKYNSQGTREWVAQLGSPEDDAVADAVADGADNLYLSGSLRGFDASVGVGTPRTPITVTGFYNAYLIKLAATGAVDWVKTYDTRTTPADPAGTSLAVDAAGNVCQAVGYYFDLNVGSTRITGGNGEVALLNFSPAGTLRWVQQVKGASTERSYAIGFDGRGDLRLVGYSNSQPCLLAPITLMTSPNGEAFVARLANAGVTAARPNQPVPLSLYPNPAREMVQLSGVPAGTRVQLLDALGRTAREVVPNGEVSVQGLPAGLYILRATDARGQHYSGRVQVE